MATKADGRVLPGRLSFELDLAALAAPLIGVALVLATRIPLRTRYLLNWDATQFALGMTNFDVIHHQPHPPGYLAYVAAGRLLLPLFGDPNSALVALSIAGECAAVVLAFFFAREVFGEWAGWVASLGLAAAPLFWYYGEAANTYALEPATVMLVAWPCWRLWRGDAGAALPAGLALGLAGAIRPSTAFFLLPLLLLSLRRSAPPRIAALSLAAASLVTLLWLLPLVVMTGGPTAYLAALLQLGASASDTTAIWNTGIGGLLTLTGPAVVRGLVWELGAFVIVLLYGFGVAPRLARVGRLPHGWLAFSLIWALPALVTFLFIHIGQVVYVQVFLPALVLPLGPALRNTATALGRPQLAPALLACCLAVDTAVFFLPARYSLAGQLQLHDESAQQMIRLVGQTDPARTVLIADAYSVGAYREAQIYLPEYHRVGLAPDQKDRLGEIFGDTYEPWKFDHSRPPAYPAGATTFVFIDPEIVTLFVADPERLRAERLPDGTKIYLWTGPPPEVRSGEIWLGKPYAPERGFGA